MIVDFPNVLLYGNNSQDTVSQSTLHNMFQSYNQSFVDYQSDLNSCYQHNQLAVENDPANSRLYETPLCFTSENTRNRTTGQIQDESIETRPEASVSGYQALIETINQPDHQTQVPIKSRHGKNNTTCLQPPQLPEAQDEMSTETRSKGSAVELFEIVLRVFFPTKEFGGRDLPELSCSFQEESVDVSVKFAVESSTSTSSDYEPYSRDPAKPLEESLMMLANKALNIAGEHEFHIHTDGAGTQIHITHRSDSS